VNVHALRSFREKKTQLLMLFFNKKLRTSMAAGTLLLLLPYAHLFCVLRLEGLPEDGVEGLVGADLFAEAGEHERDHVAHALHRVLALALLHYKKMVSEGGNRGAILLTCREERFTNEKRGERAKP
jgi:hypothetical protein